MKQNIKVAVCQYQVPKNYSVGEKKIRAFVSKAVKNKVDMVGLPEECIAWIDDVKVGYDPFEFLSKLAKENKIYLFGANYIKEKDDIYIAGFLFDDKGKLLIKHKKLVLTPIAIEAGLTAGNKIKVVDTKFGKIAMLVCKDSFHRYAAWFFDALMKKGVDIVLVPSSSIIVSERSINLWTDTIKTMSMLFNVFIIAPGTVGVHPYDRTKAFGHALIISPQTVVLAEGSENKEEMLYATLEKERLEKLRDPEAVKWQPKKVPDFKIVKQ
jgi:omega-amidase